MATNAAPIIVRRKKVTGHGVHHGGAWKVAYADFVTAMMAFFLLLWLLNSTTQEQRSGISDYFNAASASRTQSGAGKILTGATITLDGPSQGRGAPIGAQTPTPDTRPPQNDADSDDRVDAGTKDERTQDQDNAGKNPDQPSKDANAQQMKEIMRQREEKAFEEAERAIKQAIESTPGLRKLAENLIIEHTEEGLRIQIVDQDGTSMFARGSAVPYQHTRQLLEVVAKVIAKMPNLVSISGHTDSTLYARGASYTNWELSTDRSHAARRELIHFGLQGERITRVIGRADTEHLIPADPNSAQNRRISIILLRQAPPPPKASDVAGPKPKGSEPTPSGTIAPRTPNITPLPPRIVPTPRSQP